MRTIKEHQVVTLFFSILDEAKIIQLGSVVLS